MIAKVKFANWRKSHDRKHVSSGDRFRIKYSAFYDDEGRLSIEPTGKEDTFELIQSFAQSCDINTILARFNAGDTDVLQRVQGFYFDATDLPKNTADLLNKLMHAEDEFKKLPPEFKEIYGNDFAQFICTFDPKQLASLVQQPDIVGSLPIEKEGVKNEQE